ncbi:MAG: hypothetical protein N3A62_04350 [Thermodesulfovibrionales bacterium]|nr:hypothetical protein [Thermodesulfovibrionales bacterium]
MIFDSLSWQEGVEFKVRVGCSVRDFLTKHLEIPNDFIENRIAIIFLDGSPVDDIDRAIIKNGSCIAMSSQMPGLVGAAMTRKGLISPLRTSISYDVKKEDTKEEVGIVKVKLFNTLIKELGQVLQSKANAN